MADNFILITNLLCYGAIIFAIFSFVKKKKTNDEEEKMKWGKFVKISLVVFAVSLGAQFLEPENMKVKRKTELAVLQAEQQAQEERAAKAKAEREAREAKEKAERQAKEAEEKARQTALEQRKKEQEQKRNEEAQSQREWEKKEQELKKQEQERNKYQFINSSALLNEIRSNAARAKNNFNGRYLKIQGIVLTIESDGDDLVISDGAYNVMPAIHCQPDRKNKAVREMMFNLNKGQYVTVYGKVSNIGETIGCYFDLEKIEY